MVMKTVLPELIDIAKAVDESDEVKTGTVVVGVTEEVMVVSGSHSSTMLWKQLMYLTISGSSCLRKYVFACFTKNPI